MTFVAKIWKTISFYTLGPIVNMKYSHVKLTILRNIINCLSVQGFPLMYTTSPTIYWALGTIKPFKKV